MALSSHMKSKIFFTCFLEGLWQFVSGSAHEKKTTSTDELFLYIYIYIYITFLTLLYHGKCTGQC